MTTDNTLGPYGIWCRAQGKTDVWLSDLDDLAIRFDTEDEAIEQLEKWRTSDGLHEGTSYSVQLIDAFDAARGCK